MTTYYGTGAGMIAYFAERGVDITQTAEELAAYLLLASEWLDARYGNSFPGVKTGQRKQERAWPRTAAYDRYGDSINSAEIPREVEQATYQAARQALLSPGILSKNVTPNKYLKAAVSGAVSVEYVQFSNAMDAQTKFQIVDETLYPLLSGPYNTVQSDLSGPCSR